MCTRYALLEEHYRAVLQRLGIEPPAPFPSRYNLGPGTRVPVIRTRASGPALEAVGMSWGWTPPWARGPAEKLVNIRAESIAPRKPFRDALQSRRCIVPATGFYEWQKLGPLRQPFFFRRRDGQPFGLAALWQPAETEATVAPAFAVVTTEPNDLVRPVHDRMPVLLSLDACGSWLGAPETADEAMLAALRPAAADEMDAVPVNPRMNNVRYESPDCIERADPVAPPPARSRAGSRDDGQIELGL